MERRNKYQNIDYYYTDGNTVRKVAAPVEVPRAPKRDGERENRRIEHRRSYRRSENVEMSLPYVAFLFVMVIMIVMACVKYLDLNSQINKANNEIANLQTQLDTLVTKNDAMDYEINGFIDVDYILETAKTQLGMVVAGKEQVQFYDSSVSEYMNQLNDVE
ncbi:MAG: septum formation initiator family protein [Lachnospiraceae bacterium]|nr:septum formation initiator family protein [Lachnospiraceae bacterium]